jgi:type IV secretion system protein VirB6
MSPLCAPPATPGLAARLLADVDCQAFGLVERGYAALAEPGGPVAALVTALLVLAVALFGLRLLMGHGLRLSDTVGLVVRIGIVLAIATSWASWQTLAYDTLARGPTAVAGQLLGSITGGDPLAGLQVTLDRLDAAGTGYRSRAGIASPLVGGPAAAAMTLQLSGFGLTLSTVGLLVVARLVLAMLLAIAPLMAGFLLFSGTRGVAEGWLRAMVTAALVPMFVLVLLAVELAVLSPLLSRLLSEQAAGRFENATVTPIGLVVLVFAGALLAAAMAGSRIAGGIRLAGRDVRPVDTTAADPAAAREASPALRPAGAAGAAQAIAASAARREAGSSSPTGASVAMAFVPPVGRAAPAGPAAPSAGPFDPFPAAGPRQHPHAARPPRPSRLAARRDR